MGYLSVDGKRQGNSPDNNMDQRRTTERPESPWLVDQRRAPRSVRPPSPYSAHNGNRGSNNNNNMNSYNAMRRKRPPAKKRTTNPFDSPAYSADRSPASRNPSPSEGNRIVYTPSPGSKPNRINPFGSTPSPRHPTNQLKNTHNPFDSPEPNAKRTNPFESPSPVRVPSGNNPFESPTPVRGPSGNNPFESPPPQQQNHVQQGYRHSAKTKSNPFDSSTASSSESNSITEDSPPYPTVRVTVHTQQNAPPTPNKHQDSVALDSLEQILDTTEDTVDEESDDVGGSEGWSDELQQHQLVNPQYLTPQSQLTNGTFLSDSDDGTNNTTPSEKALQAAELLKKSFQQRRGQRKAGIRITGTIDEEEGQTQEQGYDDLLLEYSKTETDESGVLSGVAAKRRAMADARNVGTTANTRSNGDKNMQTLPHEPQAAQIENREKSMDSENYVEEKGEKPNEGVSNENSNKGNYILHDLCDEAVDTDDLAWRNALYALSIQPSLGREVEPECNMTPLHVACLAQYPPPLWVTRGLLYAAPETCSQSDTGGRLPLHLLVATSAHLDTIRLLVEEYPPGVSHRDDRGFTPLQLLLKRSDVDGLTLEHLRLLLGQQMDGAQIQRKSKSRLLFRKGDHLNSDWVLRELESLAEEREKKHESTFREFPDDIRRALTKLSQWKRRQNNKDTSNGTDSASSRSHEEIDFLRLREAEFVTPASIPTPIGQLLPLHLLVRQSPNAIPIVSQDIYSVKRASLVDLLRVLIGSYPRGLVDVDANGKTPLMTAMLHPDTSPSEDVVELLLGLRTPGFDWKNGLVRPASIATSDTYQLPLHVAAEELLSKYALLNRICEACPDARTMQDVRGRTPLHLALQNYRSVRVDEATLELLFVEPVAKIRDNDGKTPLDLLLENPNCIIREASDDHTSTVLQEFFDSSIERPRNRLEAKYFLRKFQDFPHWLRREACAARFVQDVLVEEIASPFTTFRILGSGIVLVLLLLALRRMLHLDPDYTFLIYYLATYHLVMQMIHWGLAIYMGEFYRLCVRNVWRWIDLATVVLSMWCAVYVSRNIIDISDGAGTVLIPLGASATMACWLSLLGYFVEWSCSLAVFVGSAVQILSVMVWPLCVAVTGFFAVSQVLYTLGDCGNGGICSLSSAYELMYLITIGQPVLTNEDNAAVNEDSGISDGESVVSNEDDEVSTEILVIVILFTILCIWWILSVIAIIVAEAKGMDRGQLSLAWYWEPKASLTVLTSTGNKNSKIRNYPSRVEQYCDISEKYWHIFSSALRGEKSDVHWDAYCFRSTPMLFITGFLALFVLPIWFALGIFTLGLLWPPQIRRWLFFPRSNNDNELSSKTYRSRSGRLRDDDITKRKLSKLSTDLTDMKAITQNQNRQIQKDLGLIKDIIFRAVGEAD